MYLWGMRYLYWDIFLVSNFKNLVQNTICAIYGVFFLVNMVIPCPYEGRNYVFVLIVICHFKIGFSQSHLTWFVVMLKIKLQIWSWKKSVYCLLFQDLLLRSSYFDIYLQITNLETVKNCLPTGYFTKIDDHTN